jgi:hypothetical protein
MKTIQLPTNKINFIRNYVQLLNGLMRLTDMELSVLSNIIYQGGVLTTSARKQAVIDLKLKSAASLNNYVKALKDKGVLLDRDNQTVVSDLAMPDSEGLTFSLLWSPSEE